MVLNIRDIIVMILYLNDFVSRHVLFWEHKMFFTMSSFQMSSISSHPIFIYLSHDLFAIDIAIDGPIDKLHNGTIKPTNPVFLTDSIDPLSQSTRVHTSSTCLNDYHCYNALVSLHQLILFTRLLLTFLSKRGKRL